MPGSVDARVVLRRVQELGRELRARRLVYDASQPPEDGGALARIHPAITQASARLFEDGHYASAVLEAYKCLNNYVKKRTGLKGRDGTPLMEEAFRRHNPRLRLNALKSESEGDEQEGYQRIYAGVMLGIRNPRGHETDWLDSRDAAVELLVLASHLYTRVEAATRCRRRRKPASP